MHVSRKYGLVLDTYFWIFLVGIFLKCTCVVHDAVSMSYVHFHPIFFETIRIFFELTLLNRIRIETPVLERETKMSIFLYIYLFFPYTLRSEWIFSWKNRFISNGIHWKFRAMSLMKFRASIFIDLILFFIVIRFQILADS